jgi:glycosyltransferase involved in cell wall biosynthesis
VSDQPAVALILYSLRAEGTPRLALDLCRHWRAQDISVVALVLVSGPADLREDFASAGVEIETFDLPGRGIVRLLSLAVKTMRVCRRRRIDAVICMTFGWHLFAAIGARLAGVRRVLAHVGNRPMPEFSLRWFAFWLMVELARPFTSALVCCSDYVRSTIAPIFWLAHAEAVTIPNGIARERWRPAAPRDLTKSSIHVAMVATLEPHKDQATLIRAVPELQARAGRLGKSVTVSLAGDGSLRAELEALVRDMGLTSSVRFAGTQRDVAAFLEGVDIFAFSTTEREGQGIALIEAMAMGLPICASDVGACRELLAAGPCGVLVPPRNPSALAQGIADLITKPDIAQRFAQSAEVRAREHYDIRGTADAYLSLCRSTA